MEKDWKNFCKGCGECCGPVPIPKDVFERNKFKILKPNKVYILPNMGDENVIISMKSKDSADCPFLDKKKRCMIYDERPEVCRLFGTIPELPCPKKSTHE